MSKKGSYNKKRRPLVRPRRTSYFSAVRLMTWISFLNTLNQKIPTLDSKLLRIYAHNWLREILMSSGRGSLKWLATRTVKPDSTYSTSSAMVPHNWRINSRKLYMNSVWIPTLKLEN
jgi:hypothetical protein